MDTVALSASATQGRGRWATILVKPYEPEAHTVIEFMPGVTPAEHRLWGTSRLVEPGNGPGWMAEGIFDAATSRDLNSGTQLVLRFR